MNEHISTNTIQDCIFSIRGKQVLDSDLANMYGVETKRLNEQVKRNIKRFPDKFRFQLSDNEQKELVANCDRFNNLKHSSTNTYAFTEQGISMLSAVLRSDTAIEVSIKIMDTFVEMRKFIAVNAGIFQRLDKVEQKQIARDVKQLETDCKIDSILKALEGDILPKQGIFFDGQIFDAYTFATTLFLILYIWQKSSKFYVLRSKVGHSLRFPQAGTSKASTCFVNRRSSIVVSYQLLVIS
jgi:hypothetical protein